MIIRHYDHFVKRLNVAHMNIGGRIDRIGKLCGPWIKNLTSVSRMFLWANVSSDTRGVGFMPSYKNVKPITSCVNTMNCSLGETELGKLKLKEQTNKPVCFTSSVLEYFRVENNTVFMGGGEVRIQNYIILLIILRSNYDAMTKSHWRIGSEYKYQCLRYVTATKW